MGNNLLGNGIAEGPGGFRHQRSFLNDPRSYGLRLRYKVLSNTP
jgi:hypothetical protein